ncbi:hypothetical protein DE146DRAFT_645386 [Phaeosphaeria sp. MPI-PUGE-AT-0046c]|nr:hypothetical protein DE146DRAFT_645386 [Phaeosphaeria sp. MPI-PUGE-AT-0046c]
MTAPPHTPRPGLQQPVAIPATAPALGSPFLRAYPVELESYGIDAPAFLAFIDELNRLMVASPPIQVLGLAGDIVGLVPLATAQIVGGVISAAATATTYGMSKGLSEKFIRDSNKSIFAPHGLKANIVTLEVVAKTADIPILNEEGKIVKEAKILVPLEELDADLSGQQRRLLALAPWTSPLQILPEEHQAAPDTMFLKVHDFASKRQRTSEEKKILKRREKAHANAPKREEKLQKEIDKIRKDYEKEMKKLEDEEDKIERKEAKKPAKMASELNKLEKEMAKVEKDYDEAVAKLHGKSVKKDKEESAVRKVLWLLIQRQDSAVA